MKAWDHYANIGNLEEANLDLSNAERTTVSVMPADILNLFFRAFGV